MKINWGTGIVIAFALFMGFILYFVIQAGTRKSYGHELVTKEYYKDELAYQSDIDKMKNVQALPSKVSAKTTKDGITIEFPENYKNKTVEGVISLYRPSNKSLDIDIPFVLSNTNTLLIPDQKLVGGRWDININWKDMNKDYLFKKAIVY